MVTVRCAVGIMALLGLGSGIARADDTACKAVLDAVVKQSTVPVRQKMEMESTQASGRKMQSELVRVGDTLYMQLAGQWHKRPYDAAKTIAEAQEAMRKSTHKCEKVRREAVNGESADLYKVHSDGPQGTSEAEIWLSVASGLPLRQHTEMTPPSGAKLRHDVTYEYSNVKAPIP